MDQVSVVFGIQKCVVRNVVRLPLVASTVVRHGSSSGLGFTRVAVEVSSIDTQCI